MKQPTQRKYTLTHNDFTGRLMLTIGTEWNYPQISSTYTHMLRDEILAEWKIGGEESPSLHVYCHVSGEALWLAPPTVRNYVFRRDMKLVLEAFLHADREVLAKNPDMHQADVFVHFASDVEEFNRVDHWGVLGDASSWREPPLLPLPMGLGELTLGGEQRRKPATTRRKPKAAKPLAVVAPRFSLREASQRGLL